MAKMANWVLGHLLPHITAKKTLGEIMKCFESSVPVIEMVKIVLLSCHVTHGIPLLFRKTLGTHLSMAKMAKLGFGPTLALNHGRKDPLERLWNIKMAKNALLPCQVTHGCHFLFSKIRLFPLSVAKWQNWVLGQIQPYTTAEKTLVEAMEHFETLVHAIYITNNVLLSCEVTHEGRKKRKNSEIHHDSNYQTKVFKPLINFSFSPSLFQKKKSKPKRTSARKEKKDLSRSLRNKSKKKSTNECSFGPALWTNDLKQVFS